MTAEQARHLRDLITFFGHAAGKFYAAEIVEAELLKDAANARIAIIEFVESITSDNHS